MSQAALATPVASSPLIIKAEANLPLLKLLGPSQLAIRAGSMFRGLDVLEDLPLAMPSLVPGADYGICFYEDTFTFVRLEAAPDLPRIFAGFHFAPGGNAQARAGGDATPQINPCSLWDVHFRPSCPDPRGMAFIDMPGRPFWADIYLLGADHLGLGLTSKCGVTIADGDDPPENPAGGRYRGLDYATAREVYAHHGKGLLGAEEFFFAAHGVTERTAASDDPERTGLDAPRTSRFGLMQATGNLWIWGHDGDPDAPRASLFGGGWFNGDHAGSRHANLAHLWPDSSDGSLGARGRGDHLTPA